ncbi:MAG TPA: hypothetical protein DGH68_12415 [Bacteroidetes bacterium]|nr:hypothetical protein [Bacteroidota bacterium]
MSLAVLMVVVVLGCTDESQISGPSAISGNPTMKLDKAQQQFKINTKVIGPGGIKYAVVGTIAYVLKVDDQTITLITDVTLKIARSGSEDFEKVAGGKTFSITPDPGKSDFVSESYTIGSATESSLRVWIQYGISDKVVNVNDLKIMSGNPY